MLLKRIRLNNFLSHDDSELTLGDKDRLLIEGRSGHGKSSFVDGLLFALYGKARADGRNLVKHGKKKATVDVDLTDGETVWHVRRSVTEKGTQSLDVTVEKDGVASTIPPVGLKERQSWIENELLRSSYELFVNSVVYPQDGGGSFVSLSPADRKDMLLEIVRAGNFDHLAEAAKSESTRLNTSIFESKAKKEAAERNVATLKSLEPQGLQDVAKLRDTVKQADESIVKLQATKVDADAALAKANDMNSTANAVNGMRGKIKSQLDALPQAAMTQDVEGLLKVVAGHKVKLQEADTAHEAATKALYDLKDRRNATLVELTKLNAVGLAEEALKLKKKAEAIAEEAVSDCPAIGKPCVVVEQQKAKRLADATIEADFADGRSDEAKFKDAQLRASVDAASYEMTEFIVKQTKEMKDKASADLAASQKALSDAEASSQSEAERKSLIAQLEGMPEMPTVDMKPLLKASTEAADALKTAETIKVNAEAMLLVAEREATAAKTREAAISEAEKQIAEADVASAKLTDEKADMDELVKAFGKDGIKVLVIDSVLPKLEARINEILSELSDFSVKLDTQKDAVTSDKKKEGLFITIVDGQQREQEFTSYSGGEKLRIVIAIYEALADLQTCRFRVLDEAFVGLDEASVTQFADVLNRLQGRFSQVVGITHLSQLKGSFDRSVTVVKESGTSKVA